jgi:hypothetical protein
MCQLWQARPGSGARWATAQGPQFFWGPRSNRSSMDIQVSEVEEAYNNSLYSLAGPVLSFALGPPKRGDGAGCGLQFRTRESS